MGRAIEMAAADEPKPLHIDEVSNSLTIHSPSDRTIRDVLNTMVSHYWLEKSSKQAHTWTDGMALKHVQFQELPGNEVGYVDADWLAE